MKDRKIERTVPRLNVEISTEQEIRLNKLIPWGMRKPVMSYVLDWLLDAIEKNPELVIDAIITKTVLAKFEVINGVKRNKEKHPTNGQQ
jgi:hypothetical protein